ncbi:hypothetical protein O9929_17005 [Vibrio lentus]|nr:hypothetical protein [Vibrio lentus]
MDFKLNLNSWYAENFDVVVLVLDASVSSVEVQNDCLEKVSNLQLFAIVSRTRVITVVNYHRPESSTSYKSPT